MNTEDAIRTVALARARASEAPLLAAIEAYWDAMCRVWPKDVYESMAWMDTEKGEMWEAILSMNKAWVRHNPQDHPEKNLDDVAEEMGDMIIMILCAGRTIGKDPVTIVLDKLLRKLLEKRGNTPILDGS